MFDPHSRPEWSDIEFYRIGRCSRNRSAGAGSGARAWSTPCAGDTRAAGLRLRGLCREADATPPGRFSFRHVKPGLLFGCRRVDLGAGQHAFVAEPEKALLDIVHLQPGGDDAREREPSGYSLRGGLRAIRSDLSAEGYEVDLRVRERAAVHSEIDVRPPAGATTEVNVVRRHETLRLLPYPERMVGSA